jgi:hypothetical protein
MSQFQPGREHQRLMRRRFVVARLLITLGTTVVGGAQLLRTADPSAPRWLWPVLLVSGLVLGAVALVIMLVFMRGPRHVRPQD